MLSTAESLATVDHGIDEVVDEIKASLELSSGSSSVISDDFTTTNIKERVNTQRLTGRLVLDTRIESRVNNSSPVVGGGYPEKRRYIRYYSL